MCLKWTTGISWKGFLYIPPKTYSPVPQYPEHACAPCVHTPLCTYTSIQVCLLEVSDPCKVRNLFHDGRTSFPYSRAGERPSVPETSFPSRTHERSHFQFGQNLSLRAGVQSPSNSTNTLRASLQLQLTCMGGPRAAGTRQPQDHWWQVSSCRGWWWRLLSAKLRADVRVRAHQRPTAPLSEHPIHIHLLFSPLATRASEKHLPEGYRAGTLHSLRDQAQVVLISWIEAPELWVSGAYSVGFKSRCPRGRQPSSHLPGLQLNPRASLRGRDAPAPAGLSPLIWLQL